MTRIMGRIRSHNSIYSISLIPLHKKWDIPTYIRNISDHFMILARLLDYFIKIKWYNLNTIFSHDIISTPYILDYPRPFRGVVIALITLFKIDYKEIYRVTLYLF